jgi:hypothetical protein
MVVVTLALLLLAVSLQEAVRALFFVLIGRFELFTLALNLVRLTFLVVPELPPSAGLRYSLRGEPSAFRHNLQRPTAREECHFVKRLLA